jgi:hypothetical protein
MGQSGKRFFTPFGQDDGNLGVCFDKVPEGSIRRELNAITLPDPLPPYLPGKKSWGKRAMQKKFIATCCNARKMRHNKCIAKQATPKLVIVVSGLAKTTNYTPPSMYELVIPPQYFVFKFKSLSDDSHWGF